MAVPVAVVVGSDGVGKTHLVAELMHSPLSDPVHVIIQDSLVQGSGNAVLVRDTPGQSEYDLLRHCDLEDAEIAVLCFAIDDPVSFENLSSKWIPFVETSGNIYHTLVLGLKSDKRSIAAETVTRYQGILLCDEIMRNGKDRLSMYDECSTKTEEGIWHIKEHLFNLVKAVSENKKKIKKKKVSNTTTTINSSVNISVNTNTTIVEGTNNNNNNNNNKTTKTCLLM